MCSVREELKTNEQLVQETIYKRLTFLPHKKLYKFRTCSNQNLKTLEENCIWMSLASSFQDSFGNTINIDPKENIKEIERWLKENYPVFCFDLAKGIYEQRGISVPYTHKDFEEYIETCLDENGNPIPISEGFTPSDISSVYFFNRRFFRISTLTEFNNILLIEYFIINSA